MIKIMNTKFLKIIITVIFISFISYTLCSCNFDESKNNFNGGEILDNSVIDSIREDILSITDEQSQMLETTEHTQNETSSENAGEDIVYWIQSGSVWHSSKDCRHIIYNHCISGTIEQAISEGKDSPCSSCCKSND